jgi:TonB family protein
MREKFKHIFFWVLMLASPALGKNVEKRAQQLWQKTPILLRTCPVSGPTIFVDTKGQITGSAQQQNQKLCLLDFSSVKQMEEAIVLSGTLTEANVQGDDLILKVVDQAEPFRMSIECAKKTASEEQLDFLDRSLFSHAELHIGAPVPEYFHRIVEQYLGLAQPAPPVPAATASSTHSNSSQKGFVHAPQLRHSPDPPFSSEARERRIAGTVVVWMIVDKDGHTRDFQITKPLGYGLDEQAIKAVRSWVFEPATYDNHPVAVAVSVEVNFRLF